MKRSFLITLFALGVLSLAAFNLQQALGASQQAEFMRSLGQAGPQAALTATGSAWAIGFGVAAIGLYRLKRWARRWLLVAIVLYQANLWLIRLSFGRSSYELLTRPTDAVISILSILFVWAFLSWPRVRRAFS